MKKIKLEGMEKSAYTFIDFFGWRLKKLDYHQTIKSEFHLTDYGSWAQGDFAMQKIVGSRGISAAKMMTDYLKKLENCTLESQMEILKQDPLGKLMLANKELMEFLKSA